ncbi:hypothetical protein HDK77DRAFT_289933 [Phyllosticta capitalensis]|uniref:Secreted protein n=1 Tax=Phyllosticta capitalensis TaxID=121624 RepID=A0ABR1YFN5_9PEZI
MHAAVATRIAQVPFLPSFLCPSPCVGAQGVIGIGRCFNLLVGGSKRAECRSKWMAFFSTLWMDGCSLASGSVKKG